MEKWILLVLTLVMIFITWRSIHWFNVVRVPLLKGEEKSVGFDHLRSLPPFQRALKANKSPYGGMPMRIVGMMVAVTSTMVVFTFEAFLGKTESAF